MPKVLAGMKALGAGAPDAVSRGLYAWGEQTRTAAIRKTPKDTGTLRNSIFVQRGNRAISIVAGGPSAPYAVTVHENLSHKIKWRTPGTGPKYIENPIRERRPQLEKDIDREIQQELRKHFGGMR